MNRLNFKINRITVTAALFIAGLVAFEVFNFSTTHLALTDLLGGVGRNAVLGIQLSTILTLAFCLIDLAGVARIFTPQTEMSEEPVEIWFLFGAWLLASALNAFLTWWAVSVALLTSPPQGAMVVGAEAMKVTPVFIAIFVWLVRIMVIGTIAIVGDKFFTAQPGYHFIRVDEPKRFEKPKETQQKGYQPIVNGRNQAPRRQDPRIAAPEFEEPVDDYPM